MLTQSQHLYIDYFNGLDARKAGAIGLIWPEINFRHIVWEFDKEETKVCGGVISQLIEH